MEITFSFQSFCQVPVAAHTVTNCACAVSSRMSRNKKSISWGLKRYQPKLSVNTQKGQKLHTENNPKGMANHK